MWKQLQLTHTIPAHAGWITAIAVPANHSAIFLTGSRDCIIFVWQRTLDKKVFAFVKRRLLGHSHFISDLAISCDARFCMSSSWDKNLILWGVTTSRILSKFQGHTKDVLSVAFSEDTRFIASGSRDNTVKLWNIRGKCHDEFIEKDSPPSWVSCVRFLPQKKLSFLACHWDGVIRIWELTSRQIEPSKVFMGKINAHKGFISCAIISPDGSLCASGGKDGFVRLWDLNEQKHLYSLEAGEIINSLCFSPDRYLLCASTQKGIKIWDLDSKNKVLELRLHKQKPEEYEKDRMCISMAWTSDCLYFLTGYMDGHLRVWSVVKE